MKNTQSYLQVKSHAYSEITEKRSRFIGEIFPIHSEEEALSLISAVQKKYHDARHHCFAYMLDDLVRASDDGEPTGTAGRPILDVLTGAELTNSLIVVTRYFGGVLLGTGGLTRAYAQAAKAALSAAEIVTYRYGRLFRLNIDYSLAGSIEYYLRQHEIEIGTPAYDTGVSYELFVPISHADQFINDITNISNGKSVISPGGFSYRI